MAILPEIGWLAGLAIPCTCSPPFPPIENDQKWLYQLLLINYELKLPSEPMPGLLPFRSRSKHCGHFTKFYCQFIRVWDGLLLSLLKKCTKRWSYVLTSKVLTLLTLLEGRGGGTVCSSGFETTTKCKNQSILNILRWDDWMTIWSSCRLMVQWLFG